MNKLKFGLNISIQFEKNYRLYYSILDDMIWRNSNINI